MVEIVKSFAGHGETADRARKRRIGRHRATTALAGGLFATFVLVAPAAAQTTQGGAGGRGSASQPATNGGTSSNTGAGSNGGNGATGYAGGGGGGAGATGGNGGSGAVRADGTGNVGAGGAGGATPGAAGQNGQSGGLGVIVSGGGGGGGAHGVVTSSAPGSAVTGGRGGDGGDVADGDGGGGGAGGYGAVFTGSGVVTFGQTIAGGAGGNGGDGFFYGGGGGGGGHGLVFTGGATATINAAITGGAGGSAGGFVSGSGVAGAIGAGGIGIVGSNLNLVLNATVAGGLAGGSGARANALYLTGGTNSLFFGVSGILLGGIGLANGASLSLGQADDLGFATAITGDGSIVKTGAGTVSLYTTNTYTGGTTINQGMLEFSGTSDALGSGAITLSGGTLRSLMGGTLTNGLTSTTGTTNFLSVATGRTLTVTGDTILRGALHIGSGSDAGALIWNPASISGDGTFELYVDRGTLQAGTSSFGLVTANIARTEIASGAALDLGGFTTTIANLRGAGTLTNDGATTRLTSGSFSGAIDGSQAITIGGNVTLSGANTYTGATTVQTGTLTIANADALGSAAGGTTVNSGATLALQGTIEIAAEALTISGSGVGDGGALRSASGDNGYYGLITLGGDARINSDQYFNISDAGVDGNGFGLTIGGNGRTDFNSSIVGATSLTKDGLGTLVLFHADSYSGPTVIDAGTLTIANTDAIPDASAVSVAGGARLFVGASDTIGSLAGAGEVVLSGANSLTIGADDTSTLFSGVIYSSGNLAKIGSGTFTLTGTATYGGTTTIDGGVFQIGDGGTSGSLAANNVFLTGGDIEFNRSGAVTVSAAISGIGRLIHRGSGTLILTGANSYGETFIPGGTLQVGDGGTDGTLGAGRVLDDGVLAFNRSDDITVSNVIDGDGSLIQLGAGTTILNGANIYSGGTTISGGTLVQGSADAFGEGAITLDGGTLDLGAYDLRLGRIAGGTGTIVASGGAELVVLAGEAVTFGSGGNSITTALGLSVDATSTLTLLGNNDFTGGIVLAGRLEIGDSGAAGGSGNVIATIGSVINYADGVDNPATILLGSDTTQLEVLGTDFATQSGQITEEVPGRGFEKIGTGTLLLTAANAYSGVTTVSAGTLGLGDDLAAGSGTIRLAGGTTLLNAACGCTPLTLANAIEIAPGGAATFDTDGYEAILTGTISGGDLTFADTFGFGFVTLTGENDYGATTIASGAAVQVGDGGTTGTLGTGDVLNDGELIFYRSDDITVANAISGSGVLTQDGDGALILTGDNRYSGGTNINYGTLQIGDGGTTGSLGTGDIYNDAHLIFNRSDDITVADYIDGLGHLTKLGAGTLTLTGDNNFSGTTSILGGTVAINRIGLGSSTVEIDNGARLMALEDSIVVQMEVLANGGTIDTGDFAMAVFGGVRFDAELTKTGSGMLTLLDVFASTAGDGGINVAGGTLALAGNFAAGGGTIRLADGTTLLNAGSCSCAGNLTIGNNIAIASGGTATIDGGGFALSSPDDDPIVFTLNGSITGGDVRFVSTDVLGVAQPAVIELGGANSYGATTIGANVALVLTGGTLGTGDATFDSAPSDPATPATLVFQNSSNYTFGGRIVGAGNVSVETDPGVVITLAGSNTAAANFTGAVDVSSGTLVLNGDFGDVIGNSATLTLSGANTSLGGSGTFHGDVDLGDGSLNPGNSPGTLTLAGNLTLGAGAILNFELGEAGTVGGASNDLVNVGGNLRLDGTLNTIASGANYGAGYYRLFNYGGVLTGPGVTIGTIANGAGGDVLTASVLTNIDHQVNLYLSSSGPQLVQYWDGADLTGASAAASGDGGAGVWNAANANWTAPIGYAVNDMWQSQVGVFAGAAGGVVTVEGTQAFQELRFETDGYALQPADGSARLGTTGGFSVIDVAAGISSDIGVVIEGTGGLTKSGTGTLLLSAANSYDGPTTVSAGTLRLGIDNAVSSASALEVVTGATFDLDGFADQVGSLTGAGNVTLGSGGRLEFGFDGSSTVFSGTISGDGQIRKNGAGAFTLSGAVALAASGTSAFVVDSGAVTITGSGSITADTIQNFDTLTNNGLISGATENSGIFANNATMGSLSNNGGTATNSGTINGAVTNSGSFTSTGILNGDLANLGTALLRGQLNASLANQGAGATTTLTGTLVGVTRYQGAAGSTLDLAGFNAAIGGLAGAGAIELGSGTLFLGSAGGTETFGGVISGGGALTKSGASVQRLNGVNTYTGLTTVSGGTLETGIGGVLAGDVLNDATFVNRGTLSGTLGNSGDADNIGRIAAGAINTGSLATSGIIDLGLQNSGTVAASGAINGFVVNSGTFALADALTGVTLFSQTGTGLFDLGSFATTVQAFSGGGTIQLGGGALTFAGASLFSGSVAGTGQLIKSGSGALELSGTSNGFGGTATVDGGGLLIAATGSFGGSVINNAAFQNEGILGGLLVNAAGATALNAGAMTGGVTNDGALTSTGSIAGGFVNRGTATIEGQLDGIVDALAGAITLSGQTDGIGRVRVSAGARFDLNGFDTAFGALSGSGEVGLGAATLIVGGDNSDATYAGIVTGSGGVVKLGSGALILTGANLYSGLTTVNAGRLDIAGGALAGGVVNNAVFNSSGTVAGLLTNTGDAGNSGLLAAGATNSGALASSGIIAVGLENSGNVSASGQINGFVTNSGIFALGGALTGITAFSQTAAGLFDLGAFSTTVQTLGGAGTVRMAGGTLTVAGASLFAGGITGTGALVKSGSGTLILTGANSLTGTTTIAGGALQIGNGGTTGSVLGPIANNAALIVNRSDAYTLAGAVTGTGMLVQAGTGTTTLTGANSYGGGTLVSGGRLVGSSASLQGNIQNDAALEFAQTVGGVFAGRITGSGTFEKSGAGLLELTGDNSGLLGATTLRGGELRVTGLLNRSAVSVTNSATLSGTGTIGGLTVASGGTVSPGAGGIGSLAVNGNIQLNAGSLLAVQVQPAGADAIIGTGSAQLAGALAVTSLGGTYAFNSTYVLVQADAGRAGTFATTSFTGFGLMYRPELVYTASQVLLRLSPASLGATLGTASLTGNQRSVVSRIDAALLGGYDPQPLVALYSLSAAQLPAALDQLSGEIHATAAGTGLEQDRLTREAVLDRLAAVAGDAREAPEAGQGHGIWGQAFGTWGEGDGDGNASAYESDRQGGIMGLDFGTADQEGSVRIGLFGQYLEARAGIDALGSRAKVKQTGGGAYAGLTLGGFGVAIGGSYAHIDLSTRRTVAIPGLSDTTGSNGNGSAAQGFAEFSYAVPAGAWALRPFVSGHVGAFDLDAVTESGGAAALAVAGQHYTTATATAGLNARMAQGRLRLSGTLAGRAQLGDRTPAATVALAGAPAQGFAIEGVQLDRLALSAKLDLTLPIGRAVDVSVGYSGLIGDTSRDHAAKATLSIRF